MSIQLILNDAWNGFDSVYPVDDRSKWGKGLQERLNETSFLPSHRCNYQNTFLSVAARWRGAQAM